MSRESNYDEEESWEDDAQESTSASAKKATCDYSEDQKNNATFDYVEPETNGSQKSYHKLKLSEDKILYVDDRDGFEAFLRDIANQVTNVISSQNFVVIIQVFSTYSR